jgi:hypothetical protein
MSALSQGEDDGMIERELPVMDGKGMHKATIM